MNINIIHTNWSEVICINENYITRNIDKGKLYFLDNLLEIEWNNWDNDYFYTFDHITYYIII